MLVAFALIAFVAFFVHFFPLYRVRSPFDVTITRPAESALLVSLSWIIAIGPAGLVRRSIFYAVVAGVCWLRSRQNIEWPHAYLACETLALGHALVGELIGLGGWNARCHFETRRVGDIRFTLLSVFLLTVFVASLCLVSQLVAVIWN